ncbi:MAG: CRISPR system precrRNA processing endoribonuclease RAMP protein Cas6 [Desulfamplus sp.]|nr:CRISPR system precrRNA processing endoribonuclease RAMP protein Cas6 [Desulfamplus sp.]
MIFSTLNYVKLKIYYQADSDLILTSYKGATLSAIFKKALRDTCCDEKIAQCKPNKHNKNNVIEIEDKFCPKVRTCTYAITAEHISETDEDTVLPYIISCPNENLNYIPKDSTFNFELILIGNSTKTHEKIIKGLEAWENYDISDFKAFYSQKEIETLCFDNAYSPQKRPKGTVRLQKIDQILENGIRPIYLSNSIKQLPIVELLEMESEFKDESTIDMKVNFISPVELKKKQKNIAGNNVDFLIFYNALRRRINDLIYYFGTTIDKEVQDKEIRHCLDLAPTVQTSKNFLQKNEITTVSNMNRNFAPINKETKIESQMFHQKRINKKINYYKIGLTGEIVFTDIPSCFIQWIKAAEIFRIGKSPTQGFGEFSATFFKS